MRTGKGGGRKMGGNPPSCEYTAVSVPAAGPLILVCQEDSSDKNAGRKMKSCTKSKKFKKFS